MKTEDLINLEREISEGGSTPAQLRRLERLKNKHERTTLGLLTKALATWEFRDDVLHTARLRDSKYVGQCSKDPQWATVEVLELGWNSLKALGIPTADFFASMPLLHTLSLHAEQLPAHRCPGITTLRATGELPIAIIAEHFPGLTTLELDSYRRPSELWAHPFVDQLDSITLGAFTWTHDVLRLNPSQGGTSTEWISQGPALRRFELREDALLGEGPRWELQDLFDAARRKGAEVVLLPEPEPRSRWRPSRYDHYDRWH